MVTKISAIAEKSTEGWSVHYPTLGEGLSTLAKVRQYRHRLTLILDELPPEKTEKASQINDATIGDKSVRRLAGLQRIVKVGQRSSQGDIGASGRRTGSETHPAPP